MVNLSYLPENNCSVVHQLRTLAVYHIASVGSREQLFSLDCVGIKVTSLLTIRAAKKVWYC
jgi:hypothetical protein